MSASDLWVYERQAFEHGFRRVAGIDEAGRGPLAGPVVSAAVLLPVDADLPGIKDSKKLSPPRREALYDIIYRRALSVGVGIVDAVYIDRMNVLKAALLSMAISATNLSPRPDYLLIDGTFPIPLDLAQKAIPKGDTFSISIAAASIVAKVTRDRLMTRYSLDYPNYGFGQNKGYPTPSHRSAIRKYGCCPIHRRSFKGVKEFLKFG